MYSLMSGLFYSLLSLGDPSMLLHISMGHSFSFLSTIPLYGHTTICLFCCEPGWILALLSLWGEGEEIFSEHLSTRICVVPEILKHRIFISFITKYFKISLIISFLTWVLFNNILLTVQIYAFKLSFCSYFLMSPSPIYSGVLITHYHRKIISYNQVHKLVLWSYAVLSLPVL